MHADEYAFGEADDRPAAVAWQGVVRIKGEPQQATVRLQLPREHFTSRMHALEASEHWPTTAADHGGRARREVPPVADRCRRRVRAEDAERAFAVHRYNGRIQES